MWTDKSFKLNETLFSGWWYFDHNTMHSPPKSFTQNLWKNPRCLSQTPQICKNICCWSQTPQMSLSLSICVFIFVFLSFPIFCSVRSETCSVAALFRKFDRKWLWRLQHIAETEIGRVFVLKYENTKIETWSQRHSDAIHFCPKTNRKWKSNKYSICDLHQGAERVGEIMLWC